MLLHYSSCCSWCLFHEEVQRETLLTAAVLPQLLFTVSVTPVIHNWWDIKDQNAQLVELIMFFKVISCMHAPP